MNILFIISSLKHGGAEKQTVLDANLFSEKHNVYLITFKNGELEALLNEKVNLLVIEKNGYLKTAKKIREFIVKENIQIVNASLFASMIISCLAAGKTGTPVLWYFHSHEFDIKLKSRIAFKYFSGFDVLKRIFFVSDELKNYFIKRKFGFPDSKQTILYNSYSLNTNRIIDGVKSKDVIVIGYIGRLVKLKRVHYLLELAEYLKKKGIGNFIVDIVGDGEEKNKLIAYADKLNLNDCIRFHGFQSDLENIYSGFDVFILPSEEECLSMALIDAGVAGLPCVAFKVGANDEIIIDGKTGCLVETKKEMFEKVENLMTDKEMRTLFGSEANKYCTEKFDGNGRVNYLENVFKELIGCCE